MIRVPRIGQTWVKNEFLTPLTPLTPAEILATLQSHPPRTTKKRKNARLMLQIKGNAA
jgi:hypothetical protein